MTDKISQCGMVEASVMNAKITKTQRGREGERRGEKLMKRRKKMLLPLGESPSLSAVFLFLFSLGLSQKIMEGLL